jgi:hypothetical protein
MWKSKRSLTLEGSNRAGQHVIQQWSLNIINIERMPLTAESTRGAAPNIQKHSCANPASRRLTSTLLVATARSYPLNVYTVKL